MVTGVSEGFTKKMELVGTGFRASVTGKELTLNVGYCLPRILPIPEGVTVKVCVHLCQQASWVCLAGFGGSVLRHTAAKASACWREQYLVAVALTHDGSNLVHSIQHAG